MRSIISALVALAVFASPTPALAHGMLVSAEAGDNSISGRVYYSDGAPGAGEYVEVRDLTAAGQPSQTMTTDTQGRFSFPGVPGRRYAVVAHGEEGHTTEIQVTMAGGERGRLVDSDATGSGEEGGLPPAWLLIGALLLLSLIPAFVLKGRAAGPKPS